MQNVSCFQFTPKKRRFHIIASCNCACCDRHRPRCSFSTLSRATFRYVSEPCRDFFFQIRISSSLQLRRFRHGRELIQLTSNKRFWSVPFSRRANKTVSSIFFPHTRSLIDFRHFLSRQIFDKVLEIDFKLTRVTPCCENQHVNQRRRSQSDLCKFSVILYKYLHEL